MSPPLLGAEEEGQSNVPLATSSPSVESVSQNGSELKERNYLGLSDCSSVDSSAAPSFSEDNKAYVNLKETELRLGLPGSQSSERETDFSLLSPRKLDEKPLFPLMPLKDGICSSSQKHVISGNKRGFSDTMDGFSEVKGLPYVVKNWISESPQSVGQGKFPGDSSITGMLSTRTPGTQPVTLKEVSLKAGNERPQTASGTNVNAAGASNNNSSPPAAKAQVVGWPPVRSYRKNTLASTAKNTDEVDGKPGPGALFVKVSMDGAPYLRKVDLRSYSTYQELSSALEKMFSCFSLGITWWLIAGKCGSHGALGKEKLSEIKLRDLLHGSDYVLTYEDKDGDWMLVGDVPWEMFVDSCKRLKIMKSSDAIGLAPRAMEKSQIKA